MAEAAGALPLDARRICAHAFAALLLCVFLATQFTTSDYGARINDAAYLRQLPIDPATVGAGDSALTRQSVVDSERDSPETLVRWLMRFRLYSIEADEHVSLIALSRIDPAARSFDPHFYTYGGAYLYPLGATYFVLGKLGIIHVGSLATLLSEPDRTDGFYRAGRLFVLLVFSLSAVVFYATALRLTSPFGAALALGAYLWIPATIRFSQLMKPHWYALLFVVIAIHLLVRWWQCGKSSRSGRVLLGACLGLAVGSAMTYASFAIFAWFALVALVRRRAVPLMTLATVPAMALATWFATNPFLFLNWKAAEFESTKLAGWFDLTPDPGMFSSFLVNSYLPGYSALGLCALLLALREVLRPRSRVGLAVAALLLVSFVLTSLLTNSLANWNTNVRYMPYVLPIACLFVISICRKPWLPAVVVALGALHSIPSVQLYLDENDNLHSTRLVAARWINARIPTGASICVPNLAMAPFNVPPFDFARFKIGDPADCQWRVVVGVLPERFDAANDSWTVAAQFTPRLAADTPFALLSHVNPPILVLNRSASTDNY